MGRDVLCAVPLEKNLVACWTDNEAVRSLRLDDEKFAARADPNAATILLLWDGSLTRLETLLHGCD